jgi:hypothetical protein
VDRIPNLKDEDNQRLINVAMLQCQSPQLAKLPAKDYETGFFFEAV